MQSYQEYEGVFYDPYTSLPVVVLVYKYQIRDRDYDIPKEVRLAYFDIQEKISSEAVILTNLFISDIHYI